MLGDKIKHGKSKKTKPKKKEEKRTEEGIAARQFSQGRREKKRRG